MLSLRLKKKKTKFPSKKFKIQNNVLIIGRNLFPTCEQSIAII